MVLFLITTDTKRILRQEVDERSFTTQYRVDPGIELGLGLGLGLGLTLDTSLTLDR